MDLKKTLFLCIICSASTSVSAQQNRARAYFKACLYFKDQWSQFHEELAHLPSHPLNLNSAVNKKVPKFQPCRTYKCLRQSDTLDLEKLSDFKCFDDNDCANDLSGMVCTNYSNLQSSVKYCNCPPGYAYNTNDCKCEPAELCWSNTDTCHKGMKCQDEKCSCKNLESIGRILYEIHGGFCVQPRSTHFGINHYAGAKVGLSPNDTKDQAEIVIVAILAAILILGLISLAIYVFSLKRKDIDFCARGDYVCDSDTISPGNRQNQPHVAAWDAPGMDFLSEEQTLKYLNRSNSIEVTKSPSTATTAELVDEAPSPSGSLPECEQVKRIHESNFDNPVFDSSESKSDEESEVTKASNIL